MSTLDPAKTRAIVGLAKSALQLSAKTADTGKPLYVGFACAAGKSRTDHILLIEARRKGPQLLAEIGKLAKDRKVVCCGSARVTLEGKPTLWVRYTKRMTGGESKIAEALAAMNLRYAVKPDPAKATADDEDETAEAASDEAESPAPAPARAEAAASTVPTAAAAAPATARPAGLPLQAAPQLWVKTRSFVDLAIRKLRAAVVEEYRGTAPSVNAELEKAWGKVDRILATLDLSLSDALDRAAKARDQAARKSELAKAKAILAGYIKYAQSEPLIRQLDENPFGVELNLQKAISASLRQLAQTVS